MTLTLARITLFPQKDWAQISGLTDLGDLAGLFIDSANNFTHSPEILVNGQVTEISDQYSQSPANFAMAMNDSGLVVGTTGPDVYECIAFEWQAGSLTLLAPATDYSMAYDVNASGTIVGCDGPSLTGPNGHVVATLWQNGSATSLGALPGAVGNSSQCLSVATAINSSGEIAGWSMDSQSQTQAVVWQNGFIVDLGVLPGERFSSANDINDSGLVVGDSGNLDMVAFSWRDGQMTSLGKLSGYDYSCALSVNDEGDIVGYARNSTTEAWSALLWHDGTLIDLNSLLPANSGWHFNIADVINDQDVIVGTGTYQGADANFMIAVSGLSSAAHSLIQAYQAGQLSDVTSLIDTPSDLDANLDGLETVAAAGKLGPITLSYDGSTTVQVSASQWAADATVLGKIVTSHQVEVTGLSVTDASRYASLTGVSTVSVMDSVAAVAGNLDSLQALAATGHLAGIDITDSGFPTLSLKTAQFIADNSALKLIDSPNLIVSVDATGATNVSITGLPANPTVVVMSGDASDYTFSTYWDGSGYGVSATTGTGSAASTDNFANVTALQFNDETVLIAPAEGADNLTVTSGQIAALYAAVLGRVPDVPGLFYYEQVVVNNYNIPITTIAEWFLSSPEYTSDSEHNYAQSAAGDAQFITDTYNNLLHRAPEAGAINYYETNVISPLLSGLTPGTAAYAAAELQAHATVLAYFSQSAEFLQDVSIVSDFPPYSHAADMQHWLILT